MAFPRPGSLSVFSRSQKTLRRVRPAARSSGSPIPNSRPTAKPSPSPSALPDVDGQQESPQRLDRAPRRRRCPRKLADLADRPRWSPDGKRIYYVSTTGDASQIWSMNPDGSGASQVTRLSTEADGELVSPDGKYLLVTSNVYPECCRSRFRRRLQPKASRRREAEQSQSPPHHRTPLSPLDHLGRQPAQPSAFHFSRRRQGRRPLARQSRSPALLPRRSRRLRHLSRRPGSLLRHEHRRRPRRRHQQRSLRGSDRRAARPTRSPAIPGADNSPLYSPDGKYLAYRSQSRAGYESDRWRLFVLERSSGKLTMPTDAIDRSVNSFTWSPDSKRLFFTVEDRGHQAIQFVARRWRRRAHRRHRQQHARRHAVHRGWQDHRLHAPERRQPRRDLQGHVHRRRAPSRSRISMTICSLNTNSLRSKISGSPARKIRRSRASSSSRRTSIPRASIRCSC